VNIPHSSNKNYERDTLFPGKEKLNVTKLDVSHPCGAYAKYNERPIRDVASYDSQLFIGYTCYGYAADGLRLSRCSPPTTINESSMRDDAFQSQTQKNYMEPSYETTSMRSDTADEWRYATDIS
jgi:hypothetical protein